MQWLKAAQAVKWIQSGQRVYLHQGCAEPEPLVEAMTDRAGELRDVEVVHLATMGRARYAEAEYRQSFRHNALFVGANVRRAVQQRRGDVIPIFLGEIEAMFLNDSMPLDVALLQVTPPDRNGFVSLGPSVDVSLTAAKMAKYVAAVTNPRMPRTHGDTFLHVSEIDVFVEGDFPLAELEVREPLAEHEAIARHVAGLIPDGATLQLGIGQIPDAILKLLGNHRYLGVHSEMFSDGIIPLLESGVIDNSRKAINPNKVVAGFVLGSRKLLDFIDENSIFEFRQARYTNDPFQIARNPRVCAVNAAIEVDLSGQVCADSLGEMPFSGIGGQVDVPTLIGGIVAALALGGYDVLHGRAILEIDRIATVASVVARALCYPLAEQGHLRGRPGRHGGRGHPLRSGLDDFAIDLATRGVAGRHEPDDGAVGAQVHPFRRSFGAVAACHGAGGADQREDVVGVVDGVRTAVPTHRSRDLLHAAGIAA